jgi:hypothetical protein
VLVGHLVSAGSVYVFLAEHRREVFPPVRAVIDQTGVLKGKTRRALDSVVLDDAMATQDI